MEGTGFGAVVGGSVGGVCGGGVSSGILQAVQMTEGAVAAAASVAAAAAALEVEDGCVPRGAVVGGEVGSGGVRRHCHIALVCRSGGNVVVCFYMTIRTKGGVYSIGGSAL